MTNQLTTDPMTDTSHPAHQARLILVDSEHFAVRFLVPVLSLGLVIVVHILGAALLAGQVEGASPGCVMLPVDAVVLYVGGQLIERLLKRVLPSRRSAQLDDKALVIMDGRTRPPLTITFDWLQTVNVSAWRFDIPRRARVPKGWYCMAVHLLQDETEAVLYTFMPPEEAELVIGYNRFVRLRSRKETEANSDLSAVAEQRRLLKLEDKRWNDGAEITKDDFRALLTVMQRRVAGWY